MINNIVRHILLLLILVVSSASAQTTTWDSTYRPPSYKTRQDLFRNDPISKKDIVFLGNSITAGTDWAKLLDNNRAKNRGISGDITFGVLDRLDEIIQSRPSKIFILIGINDVSRNIPDECIIDNYKKIISRIRKGSPKTKIYFQTLLPVNESFGKFKNHYNNAQHISPINQAIRTFKDRKVIVVDLYPKFLDSNNRLKAELTKDGLHLIPEGYQVWARILNKYL